MVEIILRDYVAEDWFGEIYYGIGQGNLSANIILPQIEAAKDEELTVKINSGGGSVFHGWQIYNALINHPKKVTVIIEGIAASIASIIAMGGDEIIAMMGSIIMVHKPATQVWMYDKMDSDDLLREAEALNKIQKVLNTIYSFKTGLDSTTVDEMINKETWLTPDEALSLNFITSINKGKSTANAVHQNAFNHIFNSAPSSVKAYANSHIPVIKNNNRMKKETENLLKEHNSTLTKIKNFFTDLFKVENAETTLKDGTSIYYEGDLSEGTSVFSDADLTTPLSDGSYEMEDGRSITVADGAVASISDASNEENNQPDNSAEVEELQNRITELEAENSTLSTALQNSTDVLNKIRNVKSNHEPAGKKQAFKKEKEGKDDDDFSEKLEQRRNEIKNKKGK